MKLKPHTWYNWRLTITEEEKDVRICKTTIRNKNKEMGVVVYAPNNKVTNNGKPWKIRLLRSEEEHWGTTFIPISEAEALTYLL